MDKEGLKRYTKRYALRIVRLVKSLPRGRTADILQGIPLISEHRSLFFPLFLADSAQKYMQEAVGRHLLHSETSVGANYRAACRDKAIADCITKIEIAKEESDESMHWVELLAEARNRESRAKDNR